MSAAANLAIPTVKAITGWNPAAIGIWSILVVQIFFLSGVIVRKGPEWIKALGDRNAAERAEKRIDDQSNTARITALEGRLERTASALMFCINGLTTAVDGLESDDQHVREIAAGRARESIAYAASALGNEDPFSKALNNLANAPAIRRKAGE